MRERSVVRLSVTPSTKCSCAGSPPILANGSTTIERRGGADFSGAGAGAGRLADLQRVDPDWLSDVLELDEAEIAGREIEPPFDLPIGILGKADRAGLGDPLQPRGNIDAVAHQIAVSFFDHVTEMHPDAEIDPAVVRTPTLRSMRPFCIAMAQRTASTTLRNSAMSSIASALDDPPVMVGDGRINQIAAQRAESR